MLESKEEWNKQLEKGDNASLFEATLDIVDLRRYPKEYHDKIIKEFESFDYYTFDPAGVEKFFFEHALKKCLDEWSSLAGEINLMLKGDDVSSAEDEIMELLNG